ncbi:MAG: decaprenyl-phosphate phosphoribosyltransferase, partial [Akkermansiaceae bacterium]|nr:decaprenyl-phosphate phosphoribosyltransferase [Akkermansiaceae bacterium]
MNDIKDAAWDRAHPTKKLRPIASGALSVGAAAVMSVCLLAVGLAGSWHLSRPLFLVVISYTLLQVAYTYGLKQVALV